MAEALIDAGKFVPSILRLTLSVRMADRWLMVYGKEETDGCWKLWTSILRRALSVRTAVGDWRYMARILIDAGKARSRLLRY